MRLNLKCDNMTVQSSFFSNLVSYSVEYNKSIDISLRCT